MNKHYPGADRTMQAMIHGATFGRLNERTYGAMTVAVKYTPRGALQWRINGRVTAWLQVREWLAEYCEAQRLEAIEAHEQARAKAEAAQAPEVLELTATVGEPVPAFTVTATEREATEALEREARRAEQAIANAAAHLGGEMRSSAELALGDAQWQASKGHYGAALRRALDSLRFSVGVFHPAYRAANPLRRPHTTA